jgi:hypothetical protein
MQDVFAVYPNVLPSQLDGLIGNSPRPVTIRLPAGQWPTLPSSTPTIAPKVPANQAVGHVQARQIMQGSWPSIIKMVCKLRENQSISASMAGRLILCLHTRLTERIQGLTKFVTINTATVAACVTTHLAAQELLNTQTHGEERRIGLLMLELLHAEDVICPPAGPTPTAPTTLANEALMIAGFNTRISHHLAPQSGEVVPSPSPRNFTNLQVPLAAETVIL